MQKISVIGAGSFGTALAVILAENGFDVKLWARREELANDIESKKENRQYLAGVSIPRNVIADHSMKNVIENSEMIIIAVPSEFFRGVAKDIRPYFGSQIVVSATKGIEHKTCQRMSQIIEQELGYRARIAVISGPNHAEEIGMKMPTASVVASSDKKVGSIVAQCISTNYFKMYQINDVTGAQICGALKNITAIATGVCDGMGFGDNAKSSIMTLGLFEMNNFGKHFGAKRGSVYGLAGVGDLIATCMSRHSRNRFVGEQLARKRSLEDIKKEMHGMVAEGILTSNAVYEYSKSNNIEMPLTQQVYSVLFEGKSIKDSMQDLIKAV